MKADITRSTYNKNKKYVKVNAQQGRVQIDADWNEQLDIQANLDKTLLRDIVGKTGTPLENSGFKITVKNSTTKNFDIGKGRYYVDGILCENNSDDKNALNQEDLHEFGNNIIVPTEDGFHVVYLDVWQRHITFIEDPELREVALGRADTTTRTKNVWQVKTIKVLNSDEGSENALSTFEERMRKRCSTGKLSVSVNPASGYSGDENRLYRVEIHNDTIESVNPSIRPTFKWSRENASVAAKITKIDTNANDDEILIVVENKGKDDTHTFAAGQWIEVTDDYHELWNIPCEILKIVTVEENIQENQSTLKISKDTTCSNSPIKITKYLQEHFLDTEGNPKGNSKVRRWNTPNDKWSVLGYSTDDSSKGDKPVVECPKEKDVTVDLEDGIQLKFADGNYVTGDYWLFPARTLTKNVEWPNTKDSTSAVPVDVPSMMERHYCPLALLKHNGASLEVICDYREFFLATTNLLNFYYINGDGQKITPNNVLLDEVTCSPVFDPILLCVGVSKTGNTPLSAELESKFIVRFTIVGQSPGRLINSKSNPMHGPSSSIDVALINGKASCEWVFVTSSGMPSLLDKQQVSATLHYKDKLNEPSLVAPIFFNATFAQPAMHYAGGDGQQIRWLSTQGSLPCPLQVYLDVAGVPLSSKVLSLWGVKVEFTIKSGNGLLFTGNVPGPSMTGIVDDSGLVSCPWILDNSTTFQSVMAKLIDTRSNLQIGSALIFNASLLPEVVEQQAVVASAVSGVLKIIIPTAMANQQFIISDPIAHSIESEVPPAIILSMLSNETSESHIETTVESFEDFCLYNWNIREENMPSPRFKAINVNQKSFCLLMEQPLNPSKIWYLRWWAIPAQPKKLQTTTFKPAFTEPTLSLLDSGYSNQSFLIGDTFTVEVIDQTVATSTVNVNLRVLSISSLLAFSAEILLERSAPDNRFTTLINGLTMLAEFSNLDATSLEAKLVDMFNSNDQYLLLEVEYPCISRKQSYVCTASLNFGNLTAKDIVNAVELLKSS